MAVLRVDDFGGVAPGIDPRNLPDSMAVLVQDCDLHGKSLKPSPQVGPALGSGEVDGSLTGATDLLVLPGASDKTYVKPVTAAGRSFSQTAGAINTGDRRWEFYSTGASGGPLRGVYYGDTTNGAAATPANVTDYAVSLPSAPAFYNYDNSGGVRPATASGGSGLEATFVLTREVQVGSFMFESGPSDPVTVTLHPDAIGHYSAWVYVPLADRNNVNIYISTGGSYTKRAKTTNTPNTDYATLGVRADRVLLEDGVALPSIGWAAAPAGLSSLSSTPFGSLMGCTGNTVHFSDPYHPHAWPPAYDVTLPSDVLDTVDAGGMLVAVTGDNAYILSGGHPDNLAVQASLSGKGGMAKGLARTYMGEVFYPCPEGLAVVGQGGSARVLTQDVMDPLTWRRLAWTDAGLRAMLVDGAYYLFNSQAATGWNGATGTDNTGVKFDLLTGKMSLMNSGSRVMGYDARSDRAYVDIGAQVKNWRGGSDTNTVKTAKWRSKEWFLDRPMNMACARVEYADDATNAQKATTILRIWTKSDTSTPDIIASGASGAALPIPADGGAFWLPPGRSRTYQFEIETQAEIVSVALATSRRELNA